MALDTPPVPFKERQRRERERLILQAAEELLLERGYHDMSIDDIAARVGISKGTVYLHFASKDDLVFALFEQGMQQFITALDAMLASPGTPREKLGAIIRQMSVGLVNPRRLQLVEAMFRNPALHSRLVERKRTIGDIWDGPRQRVTALLEEGKAAGEFDPDMPTPIMLGLFWAMLNPHHFRSLIVEQRISSDLVVAHLCRFFFKGVAPDDVGGDDCGDPQGDAPRDG
ncbi:MAG TPA: TetR/AcrR family transcriptional regulator [Dehalococcoidia bacterium]|nr:TetR/AcrR family transcriptional regulator [Dehalococcoidia bacterium]